MAAVSYCRTRIEEEERTWYASEGAPRLVVLGKNSASSGLSGRCTVPLEMVRARVAARLNLRPSEAALE